MAQKTKPLPSMSCLWSSSLLVLSLSELEEDRSQEQPLVGQDTICLAVQSSGWSTSLPGRSCCHCWRGSWISATQTLGKLGCRVGGSPPWPYLPSQLRESEFPCNTFHIDLAPIIQEVGFHLLLGLFIFYPCHNMWGIFYMVPASKYWGVTVVPAGGHTDSDVLSSGTQDPSTAPAWDMRLAVSIVQSVFGLSGRKDSLGSSRHSLLLYLSTWVRGGTELPRDQSQAPALPFHLDITIALGQHGPWVQQTGTH